jgi:signal transduction histidine kinase
VTTTPDLAPEPTLAALVRPRRSRTDRRVAGIAAGWAEQLGVSPLMVRAGLGALTAAGGLGVIIYLLAWATVLDEDKVVDEPARPADARQKWGLVAVFVGILVFMRSTGIWFGDAVAIPAVLLIMGIAAVWDRDRGVLGWGASAERPRVGQVVVGALLMVGGVVILVQLGPDQLQAVGPVVLGAVVILGGAALVFGRWVYRLATDLTNERYERVRSEERADLAAHLHDSVLQTLALIQRTDDPKRMVTLARRQERELRDWLYGDGDGDDTLTGALRAAADRAEAATDVPIEVIAVGDARLDDGLRALVGATGEAMTNAGKHAGADRVTVYAEVGDGLVEVFVNDLGVGFDPAAVNGDRRGISDSIVGRMTRHGGEATVTSEPGEGTEVHLTMPHHAISELTP